MRILILGCDRPGVHLATTLVGEGHSVTVMDTSLDRLNSLPREPQIEAILATESLLEDLRSVGMNSVDVFLAVSEDDSWNVMATQVASHIFHVPEVVCRIGDPQREEFYRTLGINVVCPTVVVADALTRSFRHTPEVVQG